MVDLDRRNIGMLVHGEDYVFVCTGRDLNRCHADGVQDSGNSYPTAAACGCRVRLQTGNVPPPALHLALFAIGLLKALSADVGGGLGALLRFDGTASPASLDVAVQD